MLCLASIFHGPAERRYLASLPVFSCWFWHEGVTARRVSIAVVGRPKPGVLGECDQRRDRELSGRGGQPGEASCGAG